MHIIRGRQERVQVHNLPDRVQLQQTSFPRNVQTDQLVHFSLVHEEYEAIHGEGLKGTQEYSHLAQRSETRQGQNGPAAGDVGHVLRGHPEENVPYA